MKMIKRPRPVTWRTESDFQIRHGIKKVGAGIMEMIHLSLGRPMGDHWYILGTGERGSPPWSGVRPGAWMRSFTLLKF